jgi:hypothetical protein
MVGEDMPVQRSPATPPSRKFDPAKFESVHQVGGIRTGTLDSPGAGGGAGPRVAFVDTGAGLRFTVALDRGGDIVDASYNQFGLAYLSPNGLPPPNAAFAMKPAIPRLATLITR